MCLKAAHPGYIDWEQFLANQKRLAQNSNGYAAGHMGVPKKGSALLQGVAVCGRCGRRMSLRYTGPNADYPVYCCRSDRDMAAGPLCQEVRALPVDALVEQSLLDALAPDQILLAMAALEQIEAEASRLERQWALRRERARYDAERARRQYDAVEPENRLVARTLELLWEEKLRAAEAIEKEYEQWRLEEPLVLTDVDRAALLALGGNLPGIWRAATTTATDRKRILRFIIREVALDQKRAPGQVAIKVLWQTGAVSEHTMRRRVHVYDDYDDLETLRRRISELNRSGKMDKEIAAALNWEGFVGERNADVTANDVSDGAQLGDAFSAELLATCGRLVGESLVPLVNLLNPAVIVLAGNVAQSSEILLAAVREAVYRRSHPLVTRDLRITRSQLAGSAELVGAAQTVAEEIFSMTMARDWIAFGTPRRHPAFEVALAAARARSRKATRGSAPPPNPS